MKHPTTSYRNGLLLILLILSLGTGAPAQAVVADHNSCAEVGSIPQSTLDALRSTYRIFYGHTSHGSQIMSGLDMLADEDAQRYTQPQFHEVSDDLGHTGDTSWVTPTRNWLDENPEYNMVMWSWCGGCSDNTEEGIDTYLEAMSLLEADYPGVTFIYMTGHLDGGGVDDDLYRNNNQIRDYCATHDKHLFDFADIESYDPDGTYYPDETDTCGWCSDWCATHDCPGCDYCAHSHCFNCYQKGKAFWTFLTRIAGLPMAPAGDVPDHVDIRLTNHPNPFNPQTEITLRIGEPGSGRLAVYTVAGDRIATLHSGQFATGEQSFLWRGVDDQGRRQGSGVYLCRLELGGQWQEIKMTLLK